MREREGKDVVEEEAVGWRLARKCHARANGMSVGGEGGAVGRKRGTPVVSLLEQGRDPPLLQTRDDGVGDKN